MKLIIIFLASIFITQQVGADTYSDFISDSIPVYHLGEIIVVKSKKDIPKTSVSELSASLVSAFGSDTFEEALTNTPGVIVTSGAKGESRLQLRGFNGEEIKILLDGRQISLPYYGDLDLNSIPLSNISKIKIVKGPASSVYGANTLGGVVNIISKRIIDKPIYQYKMSVGANDTYRSEINYGNRYDRIDYWLSMGYLKSDGYELSDDYKPTDMEDGDLRDHSNYRNFNFDSKLNYTVNKSMLLSFSAGYYDSEKSLPIQTETSRPRFYEFPTWKRHYFDVGGEGLIGNDFHWKAKLYYDAYYNHLKAYNDTTYSDDNIRFNSIHDGHDFGGRFVLTKELSDKIQSDFGITYRNDKLERQGDTGEPWIINDAFTSSIFAQIQTSATDRILVDAGVTYNRMEADAVNASTDSFDPYVGTSLTVTDKLVLHAALSRTTRFPTLNHLYSSTSGNPELGPEKALKIEIGYSFEVNKYMSFNQDFFYNDVDALIDRAGRDDPYENINEVILKGLETSINTSFNDQWRVTINHTYINAYEKNTKIRRYHIPYNKIDYMISYNSKFGLSINHAGQFISDRLDDNLTKMPDYYLAHVKTIYNLHREVKMFVNIRNILDQDYEEERYYPMPGRTILIGFEYGY